MYNKYEFGNKMFEKTFFKINLNKNFKIYTICLLAKKLIIIILKQFPKLPYDPILILQNAFKRLNFLLYVIKCSSF